MYLDPDGAIRSSVVFDNLIHRDEMPVTIGVFVDPGEPRNRNVEYDAFSDAYATFLLTEILPAVQDRYAITDDPDQWAVGGGSSGGSCALTVAWMRPDRFRRVVSFLGSFAQLHGGNRYPELIHDTPQKPLRVFLQAATRDLNWDAPEFKLVQRQLERRRRPCRPWVRPPSRSRRWGPRPEPRGCIPARRTPVALASVVVERRLVRRNDNHLPMGRRAKAPFRRRRPTARAPRRAPRGPSGRKRVGAGVSALHQHRVHEQRPRAGEPHVGQEATVAVVQLAVVGQGDRPPGLQVLGEGGRLRPIALHGVVEVCTILMIPPGTSRVCGGRVRWRWQSWTRSVVAREEWFERGPEAGAVRMIDRSGAEAATL